MKSFLKPLFSIGNIAVWGAMAPQPPGFPCSRMKFLSKSSIPNILHTHAMSMRSYAPDNAVLPVRIANGMQGNSEMLLDHIVASHFILTAVIFISLLANLQCLQIQIRMKSTRTKLKILITMHNKLWEFYCIIILF